MVKYRFDLYVRYTIEIELAEPLGTLQNVLRRANQDFSYVLREYIPLEVYGCMAPPGGQSAQPAMPLTSDPDVSRYESSMPQGPIFELHIPEMRAAEVMSYYQQSLQSQMQQIQRLQGQVTDLRQQGHGMQQGFTLLQQVAPAKDNNIIEVITKFGQGIDPCITAMVASPQDQWTNQQGLRTMTYYAMASTGNLQQIFHSGGFQPVVTAMQAFPDDPMIQQYAHHIVAHAAGNHEYCTELHSLGAPQLIIRNLNFFQNDPRVQQYGCWALGELASSPEYRDNIVQAQGISPLITAMRTFPQEPYVNRYALSALQPLAYTPDYALQIISADGVTSIVTALRHHVSDPQVSYHGITTLSELARHDGCKEQLCNCGVVPIILTTMKAYQADPVVQESGLGCLATLALGSEPNQAAIFQAGGIPVVINCVNVAVASGKSDEATVGLTAQGLNLLGNLAAHTECRPQIIQCQGVDCVLQSLKIFPNDVSVLEHGLRIIAGLAGSVEMTTSLFKMGTLNVIITAMKNGMGDPAVQMNGCYALGMLSGPDEYKVQIGQTGIEVILTSMYFHPREPHVHEQANAALSILCEVDQNKSTVCSSCIGQGTEQQQTGCQLLHTSIRNMTTNPSTVKQCLKCIAVAGYDEQIQTQLRMAGTLDCVQMSVQTHVQDSSVVYYGLRPSQHLH